MFLDFELVHIGYTTEKGQTKAEIHANGEISILANQVTCVSAAHDELPVTDIYGFGFPGVRVRGHWREVRAKIQAALPKTKPCTHKDCVALHSTDGESQQQLWESIAERENTLAEMASIAQSVYVRLPEIIAEEAKAKKEAWEQIARSVATDDTDQVVKSRKQARPERVAAITEIINKREAELKEALKDPINTLAPISDWCKVFLKRLQA